MIENELIVNTCYATTIASRNIAYYSHLIPVFFASSLALLVFFKANKNIFSKIFLAFVSVFSLWLVVDLITWVANDYHLVYATWSFLDYTEITFYVLGLYFTMVFARKSDIPLWSKFLLFIATLLPFYLTITQQSIVGFDYSVCEALSNEFLSQYKLYVELLILGIILIYVLAPFFQKRILYTKKSSAIMLGSMFLFLSIFSVSEYLSSSTGNYELTLYSLFIVPIFLVSITYSIFSLDVFNVKIISTYFLVFGFLILMASQLLFVTGTAEILLTLLTVILSISLSFMLFKNLNKESEQRIHIAKLNVDLQDLLKQRESLVHLVTHKVKGAFTRTKVLFAGMLDGTFGEISPEIKKRAEQGLEFDNAGLRTVDLVLNVANMQSGTIKFEMKPVDFRKLVEEIMPEKKISAEAKGLKLESDIKDGVYNVLGDSIWLKETIGNLIENSIKYTAKGEIKVSLDDGNGKIKFSVKDTGIGITEEDKKNLFTEGGRGKDSVKINVDSTGYGLYSVKLIIEAHRGKVWAESETGKGSTFFIELDAAA